KAQDIAVIGPDAARLVDVVRHTVPRGERLIDEDVQPASQGVLQVGPVRQGLRADDDGVDPVLADERVQPVADARWHSRRGEWRDVERLGRGAVLRAGAFRFLTLAFKLDDRAESRAEPI